MLSFNARLDIDLDTQALLEMCGLEEHGPAQQALDKAIIDNMRDYWAFDTGTLANSAYSATDIGSGHIYYPGPYAHYMWEGMLYTDELGRTFVGAGETKPVNTGIPLNYKTDVNPLAGPFPFERMLADRREDILEEVRNVARGN